MPSGCRRFSFPRHPPSRTYGGLFAAVAQYGSGSRGPREGSEAHSLAGASKAVTFVPGGSALSRNSIIGAPRYMEGLPLADVSDQRTHGCKLYRHLISAIHKNPLDKISFGGEPVLATADFEWKAKPEEREPVDIFAPMPQRFFTKKIMDNWLEDGSLAE